MPSDGSRRGTGDGQGAGFGGLLRRHRREAGLSQEALAERAGLSVDAIAALERGRRRAPRAQTLRLLADALRLGEPERSLLSAEARKEAGAARLPMRQPPVPANELIGRTTELTATTRVLGQHLTRLLTLTGPGGVGKTRLTLALAADVADNFRDGVCWVPLASVTDPAAVAPLVATSIGMHLLESTRLLEEIAEQIGRSTMLLVFDNCSHLVASVGQVCSTLLESCPNLSILASSRELLRLPGESVYVVPALALPHDEDRVASSEAVRLFVDRATARGYDPTGELDQVARVVRRLEGMPLAIELAAARTNVMTIEELADELETSFTILAGGPRTASPRQQSMYGAIEWSHALLSEAEREVFARLSVFAGGWTLGAAAAVMPGGATRVEALDLIGRLADKSLIRVVRREGVARYYMLAVIREFAADRLRATGQTEEAAARHARYFVGLAEDSQSHLRGPEQGEWLDRLDRELANLRAAMAWALRTSSVDEALRLAGGLWLFCYLRGHYAEGGQWLERALQLGDSVPPERIAELAPVCAQANLGAGTLAFLQCEYDAATERLQTALRQYKELGDKAGTALVLQRLGGVARERGDYAAAEDLHCESFDLYESVGDRSGMAWAQNHLGFVAWLRGDLEVGARRCRRARDSFRAVGDGEGLAWSLISLGAIAQYGGELVEAEDLLQESLALSQRLGYREGVAWSLNQLGIVERRRGLTDRAVHLLDESLAEHRDLGDRWRSASVLEELAAVAQQRERSEYAAFLLGAADGVREVIRAPVPEIEKAGCAATRAAVEASLERRAFRAAWSAGRAAPLAAVADGYPPREPAGDPGSAPAERSRDWF
ncbi:ATP-binding protein [Kribbella sindirgiensis]|uniref:Tetratricopeptide repeat protein n=1 Tax=Kribbella sindirgiensis TaxID=1124744 RepID=A0A4R0IKC6_9ACTN|nr:tetratricopeptide repeat protein [Kribbella sindirgiensis]TCC29165.1 tetratricopeptide repeat protein [Kribbella sindirgiensis]